jgi:hypothetical protein
MYFLFAQFHVLFHRPVLFLTFFVACGSLFVRCVFPHNGAGRDELGKSFMSLIPRATEIIASVVEKYGFPSTQQGNVRNLLMYSIALDQY